MLTVGLTGSIAVGKSYVCGILRELGCYILDADQTAREVVARGSEGLNEIVDHFGSDVLLPGGGLDRKKMAQIVFADTSKRQVLNSIVHPRVIEEQDRWIREVSDMDAKAIAVIDAALMIESGGYKRVDKLIVVWCLAEIQLSRLMQRDNMSRAEAERRIAAQMPQDEKKQFADYLIDTSESFEETRRRTIEVYSSLASLA